MHYSYACESVDLVGSLQFKFKFKLPDVQNEPHNNWIIRYHVCDACWRRVASAGE